MTEQFSYFVGMTRKRLLSFGDETLILLLTFFFLNDHLFIVCLFGSCLRALYFDLRCCLSLSNFVAAIYSVACLAGSCLHGGLNHAPIYCVYTTCVRFPESVNGMVPQNLVHSSPLLGDFG